MTQDRTNKRLYLAGLDEAGRGPLAGPVTAACVVFKTESSNLSLADSKKLSACAREKLYPQIISQALSYSVISLGAKRIDKLNILRASLFAMKLAAQKVREDILTTDPGAQIKFLVDGNFTLTEEFDSEAIIKGDEKIPEISAASILAKVTRDRLMHTLSRHFPGYSLEIHKGYPTKGHKNSLRLLGPSIIHRTSFSGVNIR